MTPQKILFVSDVHRPYHDKKAWRLLLKAGKKFKPDIIVILGDFIDCYAVSSYDKNPKRINDLEFELADAREGLGELESLDAKQKIYLFGNHEDRLERFISAKAPQLYSLFKMEHQLEVARLGWRVVPYRQHFKLGKLYLTHDTDRSGPTAHTLAQSDFQDNIIIGHTHRMAYEIRGSAKGKPHVAAMFGWLGDVNKVDYIHKIRAQRGWALGFGIGYMEPNGNVHTFPVPIVDGKVVIEGTLVSLRD